jgi:pSer/pThr/pTyr-binding forkhead associated (FHA) protein
MLRIKGTEFKIGRNDMNDLQILNPLISGLHATIRWSECVESGQMVIEVVDSSSNGTFINGKLVSYLKLTGNLDR